ncbi:hypothetical protein E6R62_37710 [Streptomyces sp. A1136]|nr:hypothetical protein E6R62_37710 [Streptomyces sp. A1136]
MKAYQLRPGAGVAELALTRIATPQPRPHEVLIKTHAAALNYRDLMYARGNYINLADAPLVPAGDGAGEIVAVGADVTRFAVGDRVTHDQFGLGTVMSVTGSGSDAQATIDFGDERPKKLLLRYAPVEKL